MPKTKLTIWVGEEAAQRLKHLATLEHLTLSEYGGVLLARGVAQRSDELAADLIGARVDAAVRREVGRMSDRLATLTVQGALEAGAARRLLLSQIAGQAGEEVARTLSQQAWNDTRDRLRTPSAAVKELLGAERAP